MRIALLTNLCLLYVNINYKIDLLQIKFYIKKIFYYVRRQRLTK